MAPFFSIVTATYNAADNVERLLKSLAGQTYRGFELLVPDGESTDATLDILERYRPALPKLVIQSEADEGIYDAWNKILPCAKGQWALFLGADDALMDQDVLEKAEKQLKSIADHIHFGLGNLLYMSSEWEEGTGLLLRPEGSRALLPYLNPMGHAAIFHRVSFLIEHPFDVSFRILGDYDFFCKHWRDNRGVGLCFPIAKVALGGLSNSIDWMALNRAESQRIRRKYFPGHYYKSLFVEAFGAYLKTGKRVFRDTICPPRLYRLFKRIKSSLR